MINSAKMLTDGMIIYSLVVADFEKLDFKNDALAGVRANYFNSGNIAQHDKTEITIDEDSYMLSYSLAKGFPLSWKVSRNQRPYQSVKKETGGVYCVLFYAENGIIYKRQYFSADHIWLRTEYFDSEIENLRLCRISSQKIDGIVTIKYEKYNEDGIGVTTYLFPSDTVPENRCTALVYSNCGMLWYDESFCPSDINMQNTEVENTKHFLFNEDALSADNEEKVEFDFAKAEYLECEPTEINSEAPVENTSEKKTNEKYSAYDKIQKILSEAQKTNKDLFGELISHTAEDEDFNVENDAADSELFEETAEVEENAEDAEIADDIKITEEVTETIEENTVAEEIEIEEITSTPATDEEPKTVEQTAKPVLNNEENAKNISELQEQDDSNFEVAKKEKCDVILVTNSGKYAYYGEIDDNNCRTGVGRTVTNDGHTAYEGNYVDDKRDGFGVCYYKGGDINYVGQWQNNNRNGSGVGYRQSDGTMHAGRWSKNVPDGYGARFDSNGSFIDVSLYKKGVRNGKSVSFDENGNVVITSYIDGEIASQRIIKDGE